MAAARGFVSHTRATRARTPRFPQVASVIGFSFPLTMLRRVLSSMDIETTSPGLTATAMAMARIGVLVHVRGTHDVYECAAPPA